MLLNLELRLKFESLKNKKEKFETFQKLLKKPRKRWYDRKCSKMFLMLYRRLLVVEYSLITVLDII